MPKQATASNIVIGYVRVSTNKQEIGPEAQILALESEAARRGWDLQIRQENAASAKSLSGRPVLASALNDLRAGKASALAVAKLDRLSRNVADFATMLNDSERQGWGLVALDLQVDTTTITGRAMAQVTVTFAEMERRRIGERTRDAMALLPDSTRDKMRNGGRPVALSGLAANRIVELRSEGLSLRAICEALTSEGIATAAGGQWRPATVSKILARLELAA